MNHSFTTHICRCYELNVNTGSHPEDRILEKESVLMILPSTSMERREGAHGCPKNTPEQRSISDANFLFYCLTTEKKCKKSFYTLSNCRK